MERGVKGPELPENLLHPDGTDKGRQHDRQQSRSHEEFLQGKIVPVGDEGHRKGYNQGPQSGEKAHPEGVAQSLKINGIAKNLGNVNQCEPVCIVKPAL